MAHHAGAKHGILNRFQRHCKFCTCKTEGAFEKEARNLDRLPVVVMITSSTSTSRASERVMTTPNLRRRRLESSQAVALAVAARPLSLLLWSATWIERRHILSSAVENNLTPEQSGATYGVLTMRGIPWEPLSFSFTRMHRTRASFTSSARRSSRKYRASQIFAATKYRCMLGAEFSERNLGSRR